MPLIVGLDVLDLEFGDEVARDPGVNAGANPLVEGDAVAIRVGLVRAQRRDDAARVIPRDRVLRHGDREGNDDKVPSGDRHGGLRERDPRADVLRLDVGGLRS